MKTVRGIPASAGTAAAVTAIIEYSVLSPSAGDAGLEAFEGAVRSCIEEVSAARDQAAGGPDGTGAEIFDAYRALLQDPYLTDPVRELISGGMEAGAAVEQALEETAGIFDAAEDEYMRQRADDIRNLKRMLLQKLSGMDRSIRLPEGDGPVALAADSLSPTDTMSIDRSRLAALITRQGGSTSHVVILARSLGIPAVTGIEEAGQIPAGTTVIVDGNRGEVILEPDEAALAAAREQIEEEGKRRETVSAMPYQETTTRDGETIHVSLNIAGVRDLEGVDLAPLYGVGLYRTEFLFLNRADCPGADEQAAEYRRVFDALEGKELIIRTMDIGGDKPVPYLHLPKEDNPFLGCRGIRLSLAHEDLFRTQIRALLMAAQGRPFSVMFPMINTPDEYRSARAIWEDEASQCRQQGIAVSEDIRIGVMIETPSAVILADELAQTVDFASIGTNDLTQYILAADRGNPDTGVDQTPYAPAVVRAVRHVIRTFDQAGVKLSVCGEAGADPEYLSMMIAMGLRCVSVSPYAVDAVRQAIAQRVGDEETKRH